MFTRQARRNISFHSAATTQHWCEASWRPTSPTLQTASSTTSPPGRYPWHTTYRAVLPMAAASGSKPCHPASPSPKDEWRPPPRATTPSRPPSFTSRPSSTPCKKLVHTFGPTASARSSSAPTAPRSVVWLAQQPLTSAPCPFRPTPHSCALCVILAPPSSARLRAKPTHWAPTGSCSTTASRCGPHFSHWRDCRKPV